MKILLIHNKYGKHSGEEAVVYSQIDLLKSRGHQVITFFRSSEEIEDTLPSKTKAFFTAFHNSVVIKEIRELILTESPDVVHIHNLYPIISPAILPEISKMGIPVVMTVHNYRLLCPNGLFFSNGKVCEKCTGLGKEWNCVLNNCETSIFKSLGYALRNQWARHQKYYLEHVDAFLCLTAFQKKKLVQNGFDEEKCNVIPNIYNNGFRGEDYNLEKRKYIAFAGRISPEKGIVTLLKAAQQLPHIPFQLAGSFRKGYSLATEIPTNVTFRGMLNAEEISDFYNDARLLLHTSVCYEGFPMVFPEAMTFKLPIIAPRMAGYPEIAEEGINGALFDPDNADDLVKIISNVWDNENLLKKMSNASFKKVQEIYNADYYYKLLFESYIQVVNKVVV